MRFMMIVKASKDSEAGVMPSEKLIGDMTTFNEEMVKAGAMIDGSGLHPSSKGARVTFAGEKRTVARGPFPDPQSLIAGYWLIQAKSLDEAIDWAKRVPALDEHGTGEIEIRQLFEMDDFAQSESIDRARELEKSLAAKR
jgi:hypothetical protein